MFLDPCLKTSGADTSDNGRGNGSDDEAVLEAALPEAQGDPRPSTSDVLASSPEEEPLSGCTTPVSSIRTDVPESARACSRYSFKFGDAENWLNCVC